MTGRTGSVVLDGLVLLVELAVLMVAVATGIALIARRAGVGRLRRWLGGGRVVGALKGIALGFVTPFCTYSAIPVFVGMVDAGIRTATVAGFLLAAPVLDPIVVAVLVLLFGWQATVAYAAVTFVAVLVVSLVADLAGAERWLRPLASRRAPAGVAAFAAGADRDLAGAEHGDPSHREQGSAAPCGDGSVCAPDPFTDPTGWLGLRTEARGAVVYAVRLVRGLALPVVAAVAVAALIVGFVPTDLLLTVAGPDQPLAVPAAAVLGLPFYVATEAFLPIAAALHDRGMGVGAVFALVISAAGINLPELGLLARLLRPKLLAAYTGAVLLAAVAAGYVAPALVP